MRRPILRPALLAIGGAILILALWLRLAGCPPWAALEIAFPGFVLVAAVLIERWRYQRLAGELPGPGWIATGERFLDPETGRRVTVFYKPATGERRYVGQ